jgi:hypothetical protein
MLVLLDGFLRCELRFHSPATWRGFLDVYPKLCGADEHAVRRATRHGSCEGADARRVQQNLIYDRAQNTLFVA